MPQPPNPNQNIEQHRQHENLRRILIEHRNAVNGLTYKNKTDKAYAHALKWEEDSVIQEILKQTPPTPNGDEQGGLAKSKEAKSEQQPIR